jgi:hypothetical protein
MLVLEADTQARRPARGAASPPGTLPRRHMAALEEASSRSDPEETTAWLRDIACTSLAI